MSLCLALVDGKLVQSNVVDCIGGYVLVTQQEFSDSHVTTNELLNILNTLFAFDDELALLINGAFILTFLSGHFTGRLVKWLGR